MSQILKMVDGGNAKSKKQQELDQIAANRKKIQDAYDSGALSEQAKANLDMISQNAQSYLAADPLKNKNARKFQLELTNRMADIVDGKEGYSPFNTEIADKNIFGYYSSPEMGIIANELVRQTLNGKTGTQNAVGAANTTTTSGGSSVDEDMHHTYDWLGGTNLSLLPSSATTKDKVNAVIAGLKKGIADVGAAHAAGKTIHGFDVSKLDAAKSRLDRLSILDTDDDDAAFNKLIKEVQDGTFAIPQDAFKSLFSKYYSQSQASDHAQTQPESAVYKDQALTNYLTNRGLKVSKTQDGKYLLTKADGSAADNFAETDPSSPYYQWGFFIDPQTKEILGVDNLNNPDFVSKFAEQWAALAPVIRQEYKNRFPVVDYTSQGGQKGIDFSAYIPGGDVRFVQTNDFTYDDPSMPVWLPFEQWFTDWNDIKNKFNYKGLADVSASGASATNQYIKSIGGDPDLDLSQSNFYNDSELKTELGKLVVNIKRVVPYTNYDELKSNLYNFIYLYLCAKDSNNFNSENYKTLLNTTFPQAQTSGAYLLQHMKKSNPKLLLQIMSQIIKDADNAADRQTLIGRYKGLLAETQHLKDGGVLFLQGGGVPWDDIWNEAEQQNPNAATSSTFEQSSTTKTDADVERQRLEERADGGFSWKPEDTLRVISLASDIGAIGASNAVGWGTAIAGGLGLVSTGLDYWADSIDKTVTKKQKNTNLGLGIGTTALGLIPDAKSLTTGAKGLKFLAGLARRGMGLGAMLAAGMMAKDDILRVNELIKNPDQREFTGDDLRLIFNSVRIIASAVLGKKMSNKNRAISDAVSKETRFFPAKGAKGDDIKVELTKDQFDRIVEVGKSKGQKEADKLFRQIAGNEVAKDAIFPVNFGDSWYGKIGRNVQHAAGRVAPGYPGATSYNTYQRTPNTEIQFTAKGPDKAMATWGKWEGLSLPRWMNLAAPDISGHITQTKTVQAQPKAKQQAQQKAKTTAKKSPAKKQNGGKLDRLHNYINNK